MDIFGIGTAIKTCVTIYFQSARYTGRTTALLASVNEGDRVVFRSVQDEQYFLSFAKDQGKKVETIVVNPTEPKDVFSTPPSRGQTIFDHMWLQDFYNHKLNMAVKEVDYIQKESSVQHQRVIEIPEFTQREQVKWRL